MVLCVVTSEKTKTKHPGSVGTGGSLMKCCRAVKAFQHDRQSRARLSCFTRTKGLSLSACQFGFRFIFQLSHGQTAKLSFAEEPAERLTSIPPPPWQSHQNEGGDHRVRTRKVCTSWRSPVTATQRIVTRSNDEIRVR